MAEKADEQLISDRRRQFLDAAAACFARKGYRRTTVHDIASEAGVADGTLYRYFEGKEQLTVALLKEAGERALAEMPEVGPGQSLEAPLEAFFKQRVRRCREDEQLVKVFMGESLLDEGLANTISEAGLRPGHTKLAGIIEKQVEAGTLREVDADLAAAMIHALGVGVFLASTGPLKERFAHLGADEVAREMAALVVRGLAKGG